MSSCARRLSDVLKRKKRAPAKKGAGVAAAGGSGASQPDSAGSSRRAPVTARMMCRSSQQHTPPPPPPQRALPGGSRARPAGPPHSAPADHPAGQFFTFASVVACASAAPSAAVAAAASSAAASPASSGLPLPYITPHATPAQPAGFSDSLPHSFHAPPRNAPGPTRANTSARQKFFGSERAASVYILGYHNSQRKLVRYSNSGQWNM